MQLRRRTILLVEDEESITTPLVEALRREGFDTAVSATAGESLALADRVKPDLVLLDVMLPDGSGFDVCRELRARSRVPIIMLTARGEEADRVAGLELGADDYVVKPFSARELVARVRAVLRRAAEAGERRVEGATEIGDVRIDPGRRSVSFRGEDLELSRKEFDLLRLLDRERRLGRDPGTADRRGVGHELVRLDEDVGRPRQRAAEEAGRRPRLAPVHPHRSRRRVPLLG